MYTYGKNLFFSEDTGKVSYRGFSISRLESNYEDSKFFPKEIKSEDGFVMLQADFPGVYDMYIPVKKELVQVLLNPDTDTANHRTKDEFDPSSGYFSIIGKLYDDAPVDYRYSTGLRYYGLGLTNYETLGYYLTKMYFNGLNKFLRANLADYEYFTSVIHANKEECPFLFTPMDYFEEESYYTSVQNEEELNKILSMTDEVYNNDFIANVLYFEEGQCPKYIYILGDNSFRYSEQLIIDKKYRYIYVYLPSYNMYQMLTVKDIKKLNKITSCKLEYAIVDDPHCFSKVDTSNEYYSSNLVDIIEMTNSIAIDMYLKKDYYRNREEMHDQYRDNPYAPITASKRFDAFKISMEFFYHNVELILTEVDFMNKYTNNGRRKLNNDSPYSRIETNSFKEACGVPFEYGFWLLSLIIRVAKISLDNIRF